MGRRPEHLSVHELPPPVLLDVLAEVDGIVPRDVPRDGPEEDGSDHHTEEDDNHEGVDEREPVDPRVKHVEVVVPSESPRDVRFLKGSEVERGVSARGERR